MTKIACIGNSHVAAFKLGWDLLQPSYDDVSLHFFCGAANSMKKLALKDGGISPVNDDLRAMFKAYSGREEITADYDAYILIGMGFGIVPLMSIFSKHVPPHLYKNNRDHHLISSHMYAEAIKYATSSSTAMFVLDLVKKIAPSDAPIILCPNPLPAGNVTDSAPQWRDEDLLNEAQSIFESAVANIEGARLLLQPPITKSSNHLTAERYSDGATLLKARWTRPTNDGDPYHLNPEFGMEYLKTALSAISIVGSQHAG